MENRFVDEQGKCYDAAIHWEVTNACNFSCPQCIGNAKALKGSSAPEKINLVALMNFLKKSNKIFKFTFTGGEPLCVENIVEVFSAVTKNHFISLNTNLVSCKIKEIAVQIDPDRVIYITASAHMLELEKYKLIDIFINNCLLLKSKKFNLDVKEVAYPFILKKVFEYKKSFADNGIGLSFMPFYGIWENKKYPDAYTEDEIEKFKLNSSLFNNLDTFTRKDKICCAGYNVIAVKNNGKAHNCFFIHKNIGSIYKNIKFSKKLIKCSVDFCGCPFPVWETYLFKKALRETKDI